MSTQTDAFDDVLDEQTAGKAEAGVSAAHKARLVSYDAPLHVLDQVPEIDVPHRDFSPEAAVEHQTTRQFPGGDTIHLYQMVREDKDTGFGSFGESETENTVWVVTDLTGETIDLKVPGPWTSRSVPAEDFPFEYEPLTTPEGRPMRGY